MLASELAEELGIEQSVMSKRLAHYHAAASTERVRRMDDTTVAHLREVHRLLRTGQARNTRQAVEKALGMYAAPVPPAIARALLDRMDALEQQQSALLEKLEVVAHDLRSLLEGEDARDGGRL